MGYSSGNIEKAVLSAATGVQADLEDFVFDLKFKITKYINFPIIRNFKTTFIFTIMRYKVIQSHASQADWTPDIATSLYTEVALPGVIPVWKQPAGAHDAYQTGDKVYYPDKEGNIYVSIMDNNIWAPDVYGWNMEV